MSHKYLKIISVIIVLLIIAIPVSSAFNFRLVYKMNEGGESRFTFTGKEKDSTELIYYGARYYSPFLRRFTQPDTIIQDVYDPQSLNRYSYVRNNPLKYVDPSGNFAISLMAVPFIIGTISAGINIISQIVHGSSIFGRTVDYGSAGKSFVSGTVAGFAGIGGGVAAASAVSGATGITGAIASGGAIGAASGTSALIGGQATSNLLSGSSITNNIYESAVSGAEWGSVIGGLFGGANYLRGGVGYFGGTSNEGSFTNEPKLRMSKKALDKYNSLKGGQVYKTINKPQKGYIMDIYDKGEITVHRYSVHSGKTTHPSNIHIDIGKEHSYKIGVEKLNVDNTRLKDLYPLFEP